MEGGTPKGWHHVDTSLAHFYFLVGSSEENGIDLDRFELSLNRRPLREPPAVAVKSFIDEMDPLRILLDWYNYSVAQEKNAGNEPPAKMSRTSLSKGLTKAIESLWPNPTLLRALASDPVESFDIVVTRRKDGWQLSETAHLSASWSSGLGGVVGVDVLATSSGGTRKFLLHFVVLHQPWSSLDATLEIKRYWVDLDGDAKPDVNERFVMASDKSTPVWVDPSMLSIDFHRDNNFHPKLGTMTNSDPISDWLKAIADAPDVPVYVGAAFEANFQKLTVQQLYPELSTDPALKVWNTAQIKNDSRFKVEARADHVDRELAPRASSNEKLPITVIPEREDSKVRDFMSQNGDRNTRLVKASEAATLMYLYPSMKTPWPNITITWSFGDQDHARQALMRVMIPLRWLGMPPT